MKNILSRTLWEKRLILEDMVIKTTQKETDKEINLKKTELGISGLWDNIKHQT